MGHAESKSAASIIEQYMVDPRLSSEHALGKDAFTDVLQGLEKNRKKGDNFNPNIKEKDDGWLAQVRTRALESLHP